MRKTYIFAGIAALACVLLLFLLFTGKKSSLVEPPIIPTPTPVTYSTPFSQGSVAVDSVSPRPGSTVPANQQIVIALDSSVNPKDVTVTLYPNSSFTTKISGNNLIIIPSQPLAPGTTYSYSLTSQATPGAPTTASFTVEGPTPTPAGPNTAVGAKNERDSYLLANNPGAFLANQLPYSSNDFSISATLKQSGGYHFSITILNTDKAVGRSAFINWLRSLGLSDIQINSLDITYQ